MSRLSERNDRGGGGGWRLTRRKGVEKKSTFVIRKTPEDRRHPSDACLLACLIAAAAVKVATYQGYGS